MPSALFTKAAPRIPTARVRQARRRSAPQPHGANKPRPRARHDPQAQTLRGLVLPPRHGAAVLTLPPWRHSTYRFAGHGCQLTLPNMESKEPMRTRSAPRDGCAGTNLFRSPRLCRRNADPQVPVRGVRCPNITHTRPSSPAGNNLRGESRPRARAPGGSVCSREPRERGCACWPVVRRDARLPCTHPLLN